MIGRHGELLGGVIAPGIKGSLDSLVNGTAKLPNIELELPGRVICRDTVTNMQAGLLYGFAGLVDGIVARIRRELGVKKNECVVVATGGLGTIIAEESDIDITDRTLTLVGLRMLYEMNCEVKEKSYDDDYLKVHNHVEEKYLRDAMRIAMTQGTVSISILQRRLGVGYPRAGKIIDELESRGYISGVNDEHKREILMTKDEFEKVFGEKF